MVCIYDGLNYYCFTIDVELEDGDGAGVSACLSSVCAHVELARGSLYTSLPHVQQYHALVSAVVHFN